MPLGVVAVVYEARPNVTIDGAALCLKSGNAIVLRGSSSAAHSNAVLAAVAAEAAEAAGLPAGALSLVAGGGREELAELATQDGVVDLIIPRGGEGLKTALERGRDGAGDLRGVRQLPRLRRRARADLDEARAIIVNAKVQRPGVCNAAETLLVHADVADRVPARRARRRCATPGVELRGDERVARGRRRALGDATEEDWATEFLALMLAVQVVDSADEAIEHINRYGSGHSEAIVTGSVEAARAFQLGVDAACVYVNASTRFTDGGAVRHGRRDRQLDAEAARARADRPARAVHVQVPGRGRRAGPAVVARVGLLGGTFNPPHIGHLVCAAQEVAPARARPRAARAGARAAAQGRRGGSRRGARGSSCAGARSRATSGSAVSRVEADVPGPSYTVDTLRALHERCPGDELTFILGGDMALSLPTWREPEAILELASSAWPSARACAGPTSRAAGRPAPTRARAVLRHAAARRLVVADPRAGGGRPADPLPGAGRRSRRYIARGGAVPMTPRTRASSPSSIAGYASDVKAIDIGRARPARRARLHRLLRRSAPATPTARPRRSTTASTRAEERARRCSRGASRASARRAGS